MRMIAGGRSFGSAGGRDGDWNKSFDGKDRRSRLS